MGENEVANFEISIERAVFSEFLNNTENGGLLKTVYPTDALSAPIREEIHQVEQNQLAPTTTTVEVTKCPWIEPFEEAISLYELETCKLSIESSLVNRESTDEFFIGYANCKDCKHASYCFFLDKPPNEDQEFLTFKVKRTGKHDHSQNTFGKKICVTYKAIPRL